MLTQSETARERRACTQGTVILTLWDFKALFSQVSPAVKRLDRKAATSGRCSLLGFYKSAHPEELQFTAQ